MMDGPVCSNCMNPEQWCLCDLDDDESLCPRCGGRGKVTTEDHESYFGANYKPCPECGGDPCDGEAPLS